MSLVKKCLMLVTLACAGVAMGGNAFSDWSKSVVRDKRWQMGRLSAMASSYKAQMLSQPSNYEARLLHAASILAALGENASFQAFLKKTGYTVNYLGMELAGTQSAPTGWPKVNEMVDKAVTEAVPVLKTALEDLEGIPESWKGSVRLSAADYPVDEDVYVDIGDVLYARASLEALIGGVYFLQGYDLTTDYSKAVKACGLTRTVPVLASAPSTSSTAGWSQALKVRKEDGTEIWTAFFGKKLYARLVRPDGVAFDVEDYGSVDLNFKNEATDDWFFVDDHKMWDWDDETGEEVVRFDTICRCKQDGIAWPDLDSYFRGFNFDTMGYWDDATWNRYYSQWEKYDADWEAANEATIKRSRCSRQVYRAEDALVVVCDLSSLPFVSQIVKPGFWEVDYLGFYVQFWQTWTGYSCWDEWDEQLQEWVYHEEPYETEGWGTEWFEVDDGSDDQSLVALVNEQTGFAARVRNGGALATSKNWMRTALSRALDADAAVLSRTDEDLHFVEYDKVRDASALDKARSGTWDALVSLDEAVTVDGSYYAEGHPFDATLLPNEGYVSVYLGALFSGKITRDLAPTLTTNEYGEAQPIAETFKDPTFAGLLPDFTVASWKAALRQVNVEMAHVPVVVKLDANGGKVGEATHALMFDEESESYFYGELPAPIERAGYVFDGWYSDKTAGVRLQEWDSYDAALFAGAKTPTLYAHWIKARKVTLMDADAYLEYWNDEYDLHGECYGRGTVSVLPGTRVWIRSSDSRIVGGKYLEFQKWTMTPATADFGCNFRVGESSTEFIVPDADVTCQATYVNPAECGYLYCYSYNSWDYYEDGEWYYSSWYQPVHLGYDDWGDELYIHPQEGALQWSPDGGKSWYGMDDCARVKAGRYTVTFRSTDLSWQPPTGKYTATVSRDDWCEVDLSYDDAFTFVPVVVADIVTVQNGEEEETSCAGGTVTLNPKDGRLPSGKSLTLTAKVNKNYAFQGWRLDSQRYSYSYFAERATTYKMENRGYSYCDEYGSCYMTSNTSWLYDYIDLDDGKAHVKAVFKAISDYRAEDIVFKGFYGYDSGTDVQYDAHGRPSVHLYATVGCAVDDYQIDCGQDAYPLVYKLTGALPSGLKFNAKTGTITGVPTKVGDATVTITATDPAKNAAALTVYVHVKPLPAWVEGGFRSLIRESEWMSYEISEEEALEYGYSYYDGECYYDEEYLPGGVPKGLLEVSVSSAAKVSTKFTCRGGSVSYAGQLVWTPDENDPAHGAGYFSFEKEDAKGWVEFDLVEGELGEAWAEMDFKNGSYADDVYGSGVLVPFRKERDLLAGFSEKYYTFAFDGRIAGESWEYWDDELEEWIVEEEESAPTGYGYLTLKTDKAGGVKIVGQLPDGEKVSTSASLLVDEDGWLAHAYVFVAPAAYKKNGWFVADLLLRLDGTVELDADSSGWVLPEPYAFACNDVEPSEYLLDGTGAEYSAAASLDYYYWQIYCAGGDVWLECPQKDEMGYTWYAYEGASTFLDEDDGLFSVALKGDAKGGISLVSKSPAPWKDGDMYNYWEDKRGNAITDPSQLTISFAKATGIFSGKSTVYFDYWQPNYKKDRFGGYYDAGSMQHKSAPLPYTGVMVSDGYGLTGFGAAIYSAKFTEYDCADKRISVTRKVSLPVVIEER